MLEENITIIKNSLLQYIGCGIYHILFLISLISIFIYNYKNCKKDKKIEKSLINWISNNNFINNIESYF